MVTRASAWTADKSGTLSVRDRSTGALSSRSYLDMRIKGAIAAVVHVDGTARVQTVHQTASPRLAAFLGEFERITSVPAVLNTSFPLVFSALLGYASDEKHATVRLLGRRPRPHPGGRPAAVRSPLRALPRRRPGRPAQPRSWRVTW
jgi:hypothetical protein